MSDFATLAYLDFRQMLHRMQTAARDPARAILYGAAIVWFAFIAFAKVKARTPPLVTTVPEPFASAIMFAFVALLGVILYGAASGFVGVFSSAADARFLCGSRLSEPAVMTWLQLRRCASVVLRTAFAIIFYAIVLPRAARFSTTALIGVSVIAATLFTAATAVPMLKLRAAGERFAKTFAAAVVAAGLLALAIVLASLSNPKLTVWSAKIQALGAGAAVNALFHGNISGIGAFYGAAGVMLALSYFTGRDLYPELYTSSLRVLAYRQRRRRVPGFVSSERAYEQTGPLAPSKVFEGARGAWTIAWKEWIGFMRAPGARRMFWFGLAGCAVAGAIFGNVARTSHNPIETAIVVTASVGNMVIIFITIASSFGLAADLRKPLWWMGPDPIWLRLSAWVLATSWRLSICIGAGIVTFAAMMNLQIVAIAGLPVAITVAVYLRSIGLALYALLPAGLDQRGPLAMLRALLTYLCAVPPIAGSILTALITRSGPAAIAAGIALALIETLLLIAFAAARIQGRGATFAQAEAA